MVKDAKGNEFVKKTGNSPQHLIEEDTADRVYRAIGVDVPESRVYDPPGGGDPIKLAKFIKGRSLDDVKHSDPAAYVKAVDSLRKHFVLDCLIGNWDVVGMNADNVLVGDDGKVYRIDNGGSLRYRAQGAKKKPEQFSPDVSELKTMRDPSMNPSAAAVYGGMTRNEIRKQINNILENRDKILDAIPSSDSKLRDQLESRILNLWPSFQNYA